MPIVGPTFDDELAAAGIAERRFSCPAPGVDGDLLFFPDVPDDVQKKILAVLAAHDGPLSVARQQALEATDAEAGRRIAEMFRKPPETLKLAWKEINAQARASQLMYVILKKAGLADPLEHPELEVLDGLYNRAAAIRDTEDKAKALLLGAQKVEEVEAISAKVEWPKE